MKEQSRPGLSNLNIGDEPALSFSYSQDNKETMVTALIHNNVGYIFKYTTMKENFDGDTDDMAKFLAAVKFLRSLPYFYIGIFL